MGGGPLSCAPEAVSADRLFSVSISSVPVLSCPVLSQPHPPPLGPGAVLVLRSWGARCAGPGASGDRSRILGVAAPQAPHRALAGSQQSVAASAPPCTVSQGPWARCFWLLSDRFTRSETCEVAGLVGASIRAEGRAGECPWQVGAAGASPLPPGPRLRSRGGSPSGCGLGVLGEACVAGGPSRLCISPCQPLLPVTSSCHLNRLA